ncbi:MAG: hypothetical protein M3449_01065 [Acidobacteriota bacterium]|nr:hypothetical protein [Acidobacteriota bacterium]
MKNVLIIILFILISSTVFAQKPKRNAAEKPTAAAKTAPVDPAIESEQLENAIISATPSLRVKNLKQFLADFPNSGQKARARESLVGARGSLGDEKLQANETSEGVALFKLAVEEAPKPMPDRLFNEIVSKFPANLFFRGERAAALEIAGLIEKKVAGKTTQLLNLATFHLGIENGSDARRLAELAIQIDPNSAAAYQTLGLAHRLNFELEESAKAYSKALELDPESAASKRSLAEMKRSLGKPDEAAALYREILLKYENDIPARTGLILSLFGAGKKAEAESELAKSLEQNPNNLNLLAGAAYWHAANDDGEKAVQLAQKAIEFEPRFIWSHIALARGLLRQNKPVDAERVLVMARRYGNFPTLEYEIASARMAAGFYREAVEELQKSFTLKDGLVQTKLGGRIAREEKTFADLIAFERRASIFEPNAADNPENSGKLKLLFEMTQKLSASEPNEAEIIVLAEDFVKGDDKMKLHRQLHAASLLLQKGIAKEKAGELAKAAVGNADAGLDVASPAAAVMASELYESRTVAFSRDQVIIVPDVPRQTLSAILRGRIEELSGWTLYQQKSYAEAVIRLRRAISVLPDKSAWWRSSMWLLGLALEADGKDSEALDSYIKSYKTDKPDVLKYVIVETLYKKVNGNTVELEAKIGANPLTAFSSPASVKPLETIVKSAELKDAFVTTPEEPAKIAETVNPQILPGESTVPETNSEAKTPANETAVSSEGTSEPKVESSAMPKITTESSTPVPEAVRKISKPAEPPVEQVTTTELPADSKTEVPESTVETTEPAQKAVEDVAVPEKTSETKKADETIEPSNGNLTPVDAKPENPAQDAPKTDPEKEPDASGSLPAVTPSAEEALVTTLPAPTTAANDTVKSQPGIEFLSVPTTEPPEKIEKDVDASPEEITLKTEVEAPDADFKTVKTPTTLNSAGKIPDRQPTKKLVVLTTDSVVESKPAKKIAKQLFEPIIIPIPGPPRSKTAADETVLSGAARVRIIDGLEVKSKIKCSISVSQENVSLLNDGGSVGILVRIEGKGDIKDILASSSSPNDVKLNLEHGVSGNAENHLYTIESVSTAVGVYQINFESQCGRKEVIVRVR